MSDILFSQDLAELLKIKPNSVTEAVRRGLDTVPPSFRLGRRLAWRRQTVEKWLAKKDVKGGKL